MRLNIFFLSIYLLAISFLGLGNGPAFADKSETAIVAVPQISQLVKKDKRGGWTGPLIRVLRQVEKTSDATFDLRVVPFKRAVVMVKEGSADFGVFMESSKRNQLAMPIAKLGDAVYVVVTLKENRISSLDQLAGKTVGRIRGGTDVKALKHISGMKYHLFNRHEDGVRLLKSKRVDALLTADFRILEAIDRLNLSYDEIARPVPVEGRGLWLYWSWKSDLDFQNVKNIKAGPDVTIEGMNPVVLFDLYKKKLN